MFYVITRRTIRNFVLWVLVLIALAWALITYGLNRTSPSETGRAAWGEYAVGWFQEFLSKGAAKGGDDRWGEKQMAVTSPVLSNAHITADKDGAGGTSQSETALVTKTVTIGDPWQWSETDTGQSDSQALPASGMSLRSEESSGAVVDIQPVPQVNHFAQFRLERDISRSRQLEYLHGVINNANADPKKKAEAHEELMRLLKLAETETNIENLLRASGISDAVVIISQGGVSVVVNATISREEAARIGSLVAKTAQVKEEQVRILDNSGV